jgi:sugar lactone lactonase YvrE
MPANAAVVIGINYTDLPKVLSKGAAARAGINRLQYAEADALDMAAALRKDGYDVTQLLGRDASRRAIIEALRKQSIAAAASGGLLVVYFAGHGDVDPYNESIAYLLPADADPAALDVTAIPLEDLAQRHLGNAKAALTMLDCCHSGYAIGLRGSAPRGSWAEAFKEQVKDTFRIVPNREVLTACSGDQLARELPRLRHGAFTYFVLDWWSKGRGFDDLSLTEHVITGLEKEQLPPPTRGGVLEGRLVLRHTTLVPERPATPPLSSNAQAATGAGADSQERRAEPQEAQGAESSTGLEQTNQDQKQMARSRPVPLKLSAHRGLIWTIAGAAPIVVLVILFLPRFISSAGTNQATPTPINAQSYGSTQVPIAASTSRLEAVATASAPPSAPSPVPNQATPTSIASLELTQVPTAAATSRLEAVATASAPTPEVVLPTATDLLPSQLNLPRGIAIGPDGSRYVVDSRNFRIQKFDSAGNLIASIGNMGNGDGQFNPLPTSTSVSLTESSGSGPTGVAVDSKGNVYVTDTWNNRIEKFDSSGKFVTKWGSFINLAIPSALSAPDKNSRFRSPYGIAVGPDGNVYVTDTGNKRLLIFDPNGNFLRELCKACALNRPAGIVVDPTGNVYVADVWNPNDPNNPNNPRNGRIQKFDSTGKAITHWLMGWVPSYLEPHLALDRSGNLYATEPTAGMVIKFSPDGTKIWDSSKQGSVVLKAPTGIAVGADGSVYVVDSLQNRVVKLPSIP